MLGVFAALILLFFLLILGVVADFGVLGALASFFDESVLEFTAGPFMAPMPLSGPFLGSGTAFLPVEERWNSPGRPVMGFSLMYSPPYFM